MRNEKQDKIVQRRACRFWSMGYKDGLTGIRANPKQIPTKYRKSYDLGHTKGMVDSGAFINIDPLREVA